MRIYNNTQDNKNPSGNAKQSCSYCRDESHKVGDCPHIAGDWAMFQKLTIPSSDPDNWTNNPLTQSGRRRWNTQSQTAYWYKAPTGWSKWYAECEKAFEKQKKALERQANKKKGKKKASKCGFCGSLDHNRRNCVAMQNFREDALKANRNWRQAFYDDLVTNRGISEGALLTVSRQEWNGSSRKAITGTAIVVAVNWDELHSGCDQNFKNPTNHSWRTDLDHSLQQYLKLDVVINGQRTTLTLGSEMKMPTISSRVSSGSYNWSVHSVLSRSETLKGQEWIDQGHADAVDFVIKKRSQQFLKDKGYVGLINKWSKKVS
jgi:hypothetical protein